MVPTPYIFQEVDVFIAQGAQHPVANTPTEVHVTTDRNTPFSRVDEIQDVSTATMSRALFTAPLRLSSKKAFLIGVTEDTYEDVKRFRTLLIEKFGFLDEDVTTMIDDGVGAQPTKINIMAKLKMFMVGQRPGDLFIFVYAGAGYQRVCLDGSKENGLNDGIITCDDPTNGYTIILDDELHEYLVKPLTLGCRLIAFFDACHSETILDLLHHRCNGINIYFRRPVRHLRKWTGFPPSSSDSVQESSGMTAGTLTETRFCSGYCARRKMPATPDVLCFSACKDSQTVWAKPRRSMLDTAICLLEAEVSPTLEKIMRTFDKNAKEFMEEDKRQKERRETERKENTTYQETDESDDETIYKIAEWAPQISSTVPLRMNSRLQL
ncbi:caspase domain-containing protein [Mycena epipterygia]|nr:caspase domain-containing protein [Mycena epipterygia]